MLGRIAGTVRFTEPLSFYTSLRIGGPAEFFVMPQDLNDVRYALAFAEHEDLPVVVIGGGNNMLVSDRGLQAVVIKLEGILGRAEFRGDEVAVGGGMPLAALIREAAALGLGGLEHMAGFPATVGGALATNARSLEGSVLDLCTSVSFLHPDGTLGEYRPSSEGGGTRSFDLPAGAVVVGCRLQLVRRPPQRIQENLRLRMKVWKDTQPFALASAGYVWKNPPGGRAAGQAGARRRDLLEVRQPDHQSRWGDPRRRDRPHGDGARSRGDAHGHHAPAGDPPAGRGCGLRLRDAGPRAERDPLAVPFPGRGRGPA